MTISRNRPAYLYLKLFAWIVLLCALGVSEQLLVAQRAGFERPSPFMNRVDGEEGAAMMAAFRNQRLQGDYYFEFQLEHKPRRARTIRYEGAMWGTWNPLGPITRVLIKPTPIRLRGEADDVEPVELIIQNGGHPAAWIRRSPAEPFRKIEETGLFEPILEGVLYTPFDLQMPFIYWEDFLYEGPTLSGATRVAQQFLMLPPEDSAIESRGIASVRIGLDDTYNALLRVEMVGLDERVLSRFSVEGFKKVEEQYIVRQISLTDRESRDRTTFKVDAASVGLSLGRELFDPLIGVGVDHYTPDTLERL